MSNLQDEANGAYLHVKDQVKSVEDLIAVLLKKYCKQADPTRVRSKSMSLKRRDDDSLESYIDPAQALHTSLAFEHLAKVDRVKRFLVGLKNQTLKGTVLDKLNLDLSKEECSLEHVFHLMLAAQAFNLDLMGGGLMLKRPFLAQSASLPRSMNLAHL